MRGLLVAIAGFLAGTAAIVGVAVALPTKTTVTVNQVPAASAMPMTSATASTMMAGTASPASRKLTILHVQRGCHVWSNGKTTAAFMRMHLMRGQRLAIVDMDVDAHQMLQFSGPARLHMGGPMMTSKGVTLAFPKSGVYRLGTKTVEMPGMMSMDVKTIGPDNNLRLVVTVA